MSSNVGLVDILATKYYSLSNPFNNLSGYTVKNLNHNPNPYSFRLSLTGSVAFSTAGFSYGDLLSIILSSGTGAGFDSNGFKKVS